MKHILAISAVVSTLLLGACAEMPNTSAGAGIGAVLGAVVSPDNPAAGAVLGGVGGAAIGSILDGNNNRREWDDRNYGGDCRGCGYRDDEYYERMNRQRRWEEQRRFERQREYEEQMRRRQWEQRRRFEEQERYNRGYYDNRCGCYR